MLCKLRSRVERICAAALLIAVVGLLMPTTGCTPVSGDEMEGGSFARGFTVFPDELFTAPPGAVPEPAAVEADPARIRAPIRSRGSGRKYSKLLKKIEAPGDEAMYGEYNDWGYWSGTSYRMHTNLPRGYWVYVTPCWYIFGECADDPPPPPPTPRANQRRIEDLEVEVQRLGEELERLTAVKQVRVPEE